MAFLRLESCGTAVVARFCAVLFIGVALAMAAAAHEESDPPPPEEELERIEAIDASQIAAEAELVSRMVRGLDHRLAPSAVVLAIEARLPELVSSIDEQEGQSPDWLAEGVSLRSLSSAEDAWQAHRPELQRCRRELTSRLVQLGEGLRQLDRDAARWEVTEAGLRSDEAPEAVVAQAVAVRVKIGGARKRVADRRAALLTLQTAVAEQDARIERALESIATAREQLVRRVLERDNRPIWDPEAFEPIGDELMLGIGDAATAGRDRIAAFVRQNPGSLTFHAALFGVLVAALHFARARVRQRTEEEEGLRRVADVFEVPYSVAFLIAISAAVWIYPYLPPPLVQLLGVAALLPIRRLVSRFTERAFVPVLNALVVFYLLDRLRDLAAVLPTVARSIFLLEMLAATALIGLMLRPGRLRAVPAYADRGTLYALGLACRAALFVLLAALMAEVLGYSRLGQLVGGAVLESAYFGIVAYAAVQIFDSIATFSLRIWPLGALGMVQRRRFVMGKQIHRIAVLVAAAAWGYWTLGLFAIRDRVFGGVEAAVTAKLTIGSLSLSLADLVTFGVTIWLSFVISRFMRFALEEDVFPRLRLARGVPYAASTFTHYAILTLGFFAAIAATGIDLNRFALLAGAFGVGIGFGLQNVVNNFVSGLILLTERPVQVGDTIETDGLLGEVRRIGIRSSTVRTWTGAELIVPNGQLISERVTNWTLSDRLRRLSVTVGVAYGSDVDAVLALLRSIAAENEDLLVDPAPRALFTGFGDSSLDFELRAWTPKFDEFARVQSDLNIAINRGLAEAEIEIPFPQRDLHVRSVDPVAGAHLGGAEAPKP